MANLLTMADIQAILGLHERGWRQRRIARELEVDRETVAKYIRASGCVPKPAKAPIGSDGRRPGRGRSGKALAAGASQEEKGIGSRPSRPLLPGRRSAVQNQPKRLSGPIQNQPKRPSARSRFLVFLSEPNRPPTWRPGSGLRRPRFLGEGDAVAAPVSPIGR